MPQHNSWLIDWGLEFSDLHFITAPTSIRNVHHMAGYANWLPPEGAPPIPHGRFTFSHYFMDPGKVEIAFRTDGPPYYPSETRSYLFRFGTAIDTALWRYEAPTFTLLGTYPWTPLTDAWERNRLTWLRGCTPDGLPALEVFLEGQTNATWEILGSVTDPEDKWWLLPTNAFAFQLFTDAYNAWCFLDDTLLERYRPIPLTP